MLLVLCLGISWTTCVWENFLNKIQMATLLTQTLQKLLGLEPPFVGVGVLLLVDSKEIGKLKLPSINQSGTTTQHGSAITAWLPGKPTSPLETSGWLQTASATASLMRSISFCRGISTALGHASRDGQKIGILKTLNLDIWRRFLVVQVWTHFNSPFGEPCKYWFHLLNFIKFLCLDVHVYLV